jgi:hypothetical protein
MADVEAFIWHDLYGNIAAVGHAVPGHARKVTPLARPPHQILKTRVSTELLRNLHLTHAVDIEKGTLSPRRSSR